MIDATFAAVFVFVVIAGAGAAVDAVVRAAVGAVIDAARVMMIVPTTTLMMGGVRPAGGRVQRATHTSTAHG